MREQPHTLCRESIAGIANICQEHTFEQVRAICLHSLLPQDARTGLEGEAGTELSGQRSQRCKKSFFA